jgi:ribonuclease D
VRYLHRMHAILVEWREREGRSAIAQSCFDFLPARARLDLAGWEEHDIFSHM